VAWESFYERVYPMMLAYSQRRLGYNEVARDAVSEALARTVATVARMTELGTTPEESCATSSSMPSERPIATVGSTRPSVSRHPIRRRSMRSMSSTTAFARRSRS
jgi:hypothetical protein